MSASLSVIIPAYNEAARLEKTLRVVVDYLRQNRPEAEVIVVDDGSADETADLARKVFQDSGDLRTSVITYKSNLGKGRAVRLGLLAARGDVALFSDADLSTPIAEEKKLVEPIANGDCDVAFGSRALDRSLIGGAVVDHDHFRLRPVLAQVVHNDPQRFFQPGCLIVCGNNDR